MIMHIDELIYIVTLYAPGGSKCPDQIRFAIAIFFSRKHAIKLFDFS